eukprot:8775090-Pyramimonas_sp.AAC.1
MYPHSDGMPLLSAQDLPRTFPGNLHTCSPEGLAKLRRVLVAFAFHNPQIGYCQVGLPVSSMRFRMQENPPPPPPPPPKPSLCVHVHIHTPLNYVESFVGCTSPTFDRCPIRCASQSEARCWHAVSQLHRGDAASCH